jgi:hypothetical protein
MAFMCVAAYFAYFYLIAQPNTYNRMQASSLDIINTILDSEQLE